MVIAGFVGGGLAGDPKEFNRIGWMPYVTQAGVGLGLATVIAAKYPEWGPEFATIIISVIVLNQIVGPPLFKWAIIHVKESHTRADTPEFDGRKDAIIFGLESQSLALASSLEAHGWFVTIATRRKETAEAYKHEFKIKVFDQFDLNTFKALHAEKMEAIVFMLSDEENYEMSEYAYEHYGTKEIIVRLNDRANTEKFHELGALIVEPTTAIVSLLDHMVRSPHATSMLLGMEENQGHNRSGSL